MTNKKRLDKDVIGVEVVRKRMFWKGTVEFNRSTEDEEWQSKKNARFPWS